MRQTCAILLIAIFALSCSVSFAASKDSRDILRQGLLGAGSGAVGGLASGAKGGDVWKGALAGAGVNIVGGALLDSLSGEKVDSVNNVQRMDPENAYQQGYQAGFHNGYKQGYTEGFKEGISQN